VTLPRRKPGISSPSVGGDTSFAGVKFAPPGNCRAALSHKLRE
jgi:hypothetical protein